MSEILVDTNILVYLLDKKEAKRHEKTLQWFQNLKRDKNSYFISLQNLREFSSICLKKTKLKHEKINEWTELFSRIFYLVSDSKEDGIKATQICRKNKISFWDSLLIATMQRCDIRHILTENIKDFQKYSKIKTINLFR